MMSILKAKSIAAMRRSALHTQCGRQGAGMCFGGETLRFRPVGIAAQTLDRYTNNR
jgi:hypothetical protein